MDTPAWLKEEDTLQTNYAAPTEAQISNSLGSQETIAQEYQPETTIAHEENFTETISNQSVSTILTTNKPQDGPKNAFGEKAGLDPTPSDAPEPTPFANKMEEEFINSITGDN
jgi:hypothetical protein